MSLTRRDFIRDAAVTGAVTATTMIGTGTLSNADKSHSVSSAAETKNCPFFDQPLFCGGPGADGRYPCD